MRGWGESVLGPEEEVNVFNTHSFNRRYFVRSIRPNDMQIARKAGPPPYNQGTSGAFLLELAGQTEEQEEDE